MILVTASFAAHVPAAATALCFQPAACWTVVAYRATWGAAIPLIRWEWWAICTDWLILRRCRATLEIRIALRIPLRLTLRLTLWMPLRIPLRRRVALRLTRILKTGIEVRARSNAIGCLRRCHIAAAAYCEHSPENRPDKCQGAEGRSF